MSVDMTKVARGTVVAERYGRDGRSVTSEIATGIPDVVLAVSTFHRDGGNYWTTAVGVRHMPRDGVFSVSKSSPLDSKRVGVANVGARFSRKNLDVVHASFMREAGLLLAAGSFDHVIAATPPAED